MTEDKIVEDSLKLKNLIEKNAKEKVKRQTGIRVGQAYRLSKGEDVVDYDYYFSEMKLNEKERRFFESFNLLSRGKIVRIASPSRSIMKIKDPAKLEEVLKIYKEVYDRTLEVLIELGEVGYIKGENESEMKE